MQLHWKKELAAICCIVSISIAVAVAAPAATTSALPLFDPARSSSINMRMDKPLRIHYADANTELSGYECKDDVRLGDYQARLSFACWTNAPNQQFWAEMGNGVLGLGPKYQKQHDEDGHPMPEPLLLGMTDPNAVDSNAAGLPKKFAFMATEAGAELQLGGYVPSSIKGDMMVIPSLSTKSYNIPISSIKVHASSPTMRWRELTYAVLLPDRRLLRHCDGAADLYGRRSQDAHPCHPRQVCIPLRRSIADIVEELTLEWQRVALHHAPEQQGTRHAARVSVRHLPEARAQVEEDVHHRQRHHAGILSHLSPSTHRALTPGLTNCQACCAFSTSTFLAGSRRDWSSTSRSLMSSTTRTSTLRGARARALA